MKKYTVRKIREYTGHQGPVYSLAKSNRPETFLSCGSDGFIIEWDVFSGKGTAIAKAKGPIFSFRLVPERNLLLLGLESGDLVFADLRLKKILKTVRLHKKAIFDFLPFPDGKHLLASGADGALSVWDLECLDHLHYQRVCHKSIRTMVLHPEKDKIICGASDGKIREFELGLVQTKSWEANLPAVFRLRFGANGKILLSTGRDAMLTSWDVDHGYQKLHSVPAHLYTVNDIVSGPDTSLAFTGSMDKSIKLWDIGNLELLKVCNYEKNQAHRHGINRLLYTKNGLLSCGDDKKIMLWEFKY